MRYILALLGVSIVFASAAYAATSGEGTPMNARVTCYAPGWDPKMEGGFETSKPGVDGQGVPRTLDDFRLGKSKYVTLAANPMHYGKYYNMGTITYVSNIDQRTYTVSNVVGYVHDTGSAFRVPTCQKYNTCGVVYRKFDIAYGDYRRGGNIGLVNSSALCGNKDYQWTQIGGPLTTPPDVTAGAYVNAPWSPNPSSSGSPWASNNPQTIGQAYQSNQPTQSGYPTAIPPQQAQPVYQPGQYFNPQQTGVSTPYSTGLSALPPISFESSAITGEPVASVADKLLSLLGVPVTKSLSNVPAEKGASSSPIRVETSGGKFTITSIGRPGIVYTTGSSTEDVEVNPVETFGVAENIEATSSSETSDPLFAALLRLRDILAGILQSLRALIGVL